MEWIEEGKVELNGMEFERGETERDHRVEQVSSPRDEIGS